MKSSRIAVLLVAIAAVIAVATLAGHKGGGSSSTSTGPKAPANAIRVAFDYSPEKEILLKPLIDQFNRQHVIVSGKPVFVDGTAASSGEDETKLARKQLQLTAWSPASSLWGRLLDYEADAKYAPDTNPSIVRTPLVIAMWEPMARALGYPKRPLGFSDLLRLARDPRGWAAYGRPEFGAFKLVHTNPDYSTSGLSAVVAEYYAATGKLEGLTAADVVGSKARTTVKDLERSIVHYGDTTLFVSDQMRAEGPAYASAVAMEEATLVDFNRHRGKQPKLVAIYPREGTFYSDSPFIVLDAPWVTATQRAGAHAFQRWLAQKITPDVAARGGFRPADPHLKALAPVDAAHGADPAQPRRVLGLPEPRVLARVKSTWRVDRKPANVLLVVDTSGSMLDEDKLVHAQQGLRSFLNGVSAQDRIGLTSFSTDINPLVPIGPIRDNRNRLQQAVDGLTPDGQTSLFDATDAAVRDVRSGAGPDHINAVVILTDGEDTNSSLGSDKVIADLRGQAEDPQRVRVFTIAYGSGASGSQQVLHDIAAASGGKDYTGSTGDITAVYRSISSFF